MTDTSRTEREAKAAREELHAIVEHARENAAAQAAEHDRQEPGQAWPCAWEGRATTPVDLVLEGGAMRGLFTGGVLDVMADRGLLCDRVIGVSAGALYGYNYVAGTTGRGSFVNVKYCSDPRYLSLRSFMRTGNVYGRSFAFDEVPNRLERFRYASFDDSPMTLVAVSSDLDAGEADYHAFTNAEDDLPYLIASSSMPLVSRTVEVDGKRLLDGGTCDSVPIVYAKMTRPGKKIVIRTQHASYRKRPNKLMALMNQRYAEFPDYLERASMRHYEYNRTCKMLERMHRDGEAFVISPPVPVQVSNIEHDPRKLLALYEQGVAEVARVWDDLERYLAS